MESKSEVPHHKILGEEESDRMNKLSPTSKIEFLRDKMESLDLRKSELDSIRKKFDDLIDEESSNNPMVAASPIIRPHDYDVLISDITEKILSLLEKH
jgi:hypothetical protein